MVVLPQLVAERYCDRGITFVIEIDDADVGHPDCPPCIVGIFAIVNTDRKELCGQQPTAGTHDNRAFSAFPDSLI